MFPLQRISSFVTPTTIYKFDDKLNNKRIIRYSLIKHFKIMKKFDVATKSGINVTFDFPTSIKELSEDYLKQISDGITIADNYTLVGLCYLESLTRIIFTSRSKSNKDVKIKVTPIFVKAGKTDVDYINTAKIKQPLVIMPTQLSLGMHVNLPKHKLTIDYFNTVVRESVENLYEKEVQNADQRECIFIEFKLVPNCDILGLLNTDLPDINPNYVQVFGVDMHKDDKE